MLDDYLEILPTDLSLPGDQVDAAESDDQEYYDLFHESESDERIMIDPPRQPAHDEES